MSTLLKSYDQDIGYIAARGDFLSKKWWSMQ